MIRTTLSKSYIKRTIRPLYGWHQATAVHVSLDPAWDRSVDIWPGFVMALNGPQQVTLIGSDVQPFGLCAHYIGGDGIDELLDQGINQMAVWVLGGPDAQFEVLSPAFDTSLTYAVGDLLYGSNSGATRGKLANSTSSTEGTKPIARVVQVNSATKLTIGGLFGTV